MGMLLFGFTGKDIQRGANQIIECLLRYIRRTDHTLRNEDLSQQWCRIRCCREQHEYLYWKGICYMLWTEIPEPVNRRLSLRQECLDQLFGAFCKAKTYIPFIFRQFNYWSPTTCMIAFAWWFLHQSSVDPQFPNSVTFSDEVVFSQHAHIDLTTEPDHEQRKNTSLLMCGGYRGGQFSGIIHLTTWTGGSQVSWLYSGGFFRKCSSMSPHTFDAKCGFKMRDPLIRQDAYLTIWR